MQAKALTELAKECHKLGLNVLVYTGFTFEQLLNGFESHPEWKELLENTDILVDGPFILSQRSLMLHFRGSKNQRILDVAKSLQESKAVIREDL